MKLFLLTSLLLTVLAIPAAAQQDCTIQYLGRNADQSIPGEPGAISDIVDPNVGSPLITSNGWSFGQRTTGDSYQATNTWRFHLPTSLDPSSSLDKTKPALDVFQITCTDP